MALNMKPACERCEAGRAQDDEAYTCGGESVVRPRRDVPPGAI